ncbi:MAG: hypothetical protein H6945_03785 [Zoogloeaceae bacterium]|nr:hypothetical protein [Rhodocyclaceae bacterium]MCP5234844.1 hypothetical protein [Zoogloeaceae bacterium]
MNIPPCRLLVSMLPLLMTITLSGILIADLAAAVSTPIVERQPAPDARELCRRLVESAGACPPFRAATTGRAGIDGRRDGARARFEA